MSEVTIATMTARWSGLERPLFKGKLIDNDGCKCAQGDVLFCAGYTDDQLRKMEQSKADTETARVLGISRTHAVLLRQVNDKVDGAPQLVLTNPEQILGDKATLLLAFWKHLDCMTHAALASTLAAWNAAGAADAAWAAAWDAASTNSWDAASTVDWDAARASLEIQGMGKLEADGRQPYFLAVFGFDTWDKVRAIAEPSL